MLNQWKVQSMSSLPGNEFLDPIFDEADFIKGFKVIWYVINNFFVSFEKCIRIVINEMFMNSGNVSYVSWKA